jgi:tripartite-type tricarboxylate transporter receptor subunit TctC
MNKAIVINMVRGFAKNLSDKEIIEYEDELKQIVKDEKIKRRIK